MKLIAFYPENIIKQNYYKDSSFTILSKFVSNFDDNLQPYIIACDFSKNVNIFNCNIEDLLENLKNIIKDDTVLIFDNCTEGNLLPILYKIYKILDLNLIKPERIFCFSGTLNIEESHQYFCNISNITPNKINLIGISSWEYITKKNSLTYNIPENVSDYEIKIKQKNFICWNRVLRWHRFMLVNLLSKYKLLDKSWISFYQNGTHRNTTEKNLISNYFLSKCGQALNNDLLFHDIKSEYEKLLPELPLTVNIEKNNNKNYIDLDDLHYFNNSYFSLVTETFYFPKNQYHTIDETGIFFTEKIFKPIAAMHPFIIVSRPYSLNFLKKMGYKTFHPYINESYDNIESDDKRLIAIVEEVKRLCEQTDNQWLEWQNNIKNIVEYNFSIFYKKEYYVSSKYLNSSICTI